MRAPPLDAAVVALIAVGYLAFGAFVGGGYDPGRDVAVAWSIVRDGATPLLGPLIAGHAHLGPAWFYALALPLALWPAWLSVALFVMLVGACQFPLAFAAGRRLADARLGMLWALALAMPGWASFESVGFASTNVMRTLTLATVYVLVRVRDAPRLAGWLGAGLLASLATHAHPSCAWLVLVAAAAAWRRPGAAGAPLRPRAAALLAVAAGFALPFLPLLAAPPAVVASTYDVAGANAGIANLARVPALLWSIAWRGPQAIMSAVYPPAHVPAANVALLAALAGIAGALRGVAAAIGGDRAARLGVALTLVSVVFVALIRPVTPVYMAYSIVPGYALLVAAGWRALLRRWPFATAIGVGVVLATALAVGVGVVRSMRDGGGRIEPVIADITRPLPATPTPPDVWLAALDADRLGRALCVAPAPVHGALAYVLDVFYAMPLRMHCAAEVPRFTQEAAGTPAAGRLGLAMRHYRALGAAPSQRIGGIGLEAVARIVAAPPRRDLPQDDTYPPHPYIAGAPLRIGYAFDAPSAEVLVVANPRVTWMPGWTSDVRCDGTALAPVSADLVTRLYRCPAGSLHRWQVNVAAADPQAIEIVSFVPRTPH
jgi:hypothetical protein